MHFTEQGIVSDLKLPVLKKVLYFFRGFLIFLHSNANDSA